MNKGWINNWNLAVALLILGAMGCSSDPKLSAKGYQQAMALMNACSRKDEKAIEQIATAVKTSQSNSEISESEADVLLGVIANARNGSWDWSTARVRKLMESQAIAAPQNQQGEARQRHRH